MAENKSLPFSEVIKALLDTTRPFPAYFLHRFSDLLSQDFSLLKNAWPQVPVARRATILEDLEDLAEADTLLCFDDLAVHALDDENPEVRERAINLLWESEDAKLAPRLIKILENDPEENVRAAAAGALGQFVYLGELEQIPAAIHQQVEESLLGQFAKNETKLIRRKALESLGYSGREEVAALIQNAFSTNQQEWVASALCAMGRSADFHWEPLILKMLNHPEARVQEEAIRAAGGLELAAAREPLLALLEEGASLDDGVYGALIWSLSQIGGSNVRAALEKLMEEAEDDVEIEYLEAALDNLEFSESFGPLDLFDIDLESDLDGSFHDEDDPDENDDNNKG